LFPAAQSRNPGGESGHPQNRAVVRLATASVLSIAGLPLLVTRWPAPMIGLALLCAGAWLAVTAARRRRPARGRARR
jgi:hypothetical protein